MVGESRRRISSPVALVTDDTIWIVHCKGLSKKVTCVGEVEATTAKMPAAAYSRARRPRTSPENYKRKIIDARIPSDASAIPWTSPRWWVFLAGDAPAYVIGVSLPVDDRVLVN
jgi:hypothetical protein